MPYTILPAEIADIPAIIKVADAAFKDDPFIGQMMPDVSMEEREQFYRPMYLRTFEKPYLAGEVYHKAVDEQGKIVGYSRWAYPHSLTAEQQAERRRLEEEDKINRPLPAGANKALWETFFHELKTRREKYVHEEKDYFLHVLAVAPDHQGQGIASLLIRRGLDLADRDNARAYIEASPRGLPVYLKFGWRPLEELKLDMSRFGGQGDAVEVCMMRESKNP